ncbi:hypothetical protein PFISCL1PPCAC_558 [Pristionchus fissidentatus]|uniref:Uncharacterized protein n=1 Tax=Pristionchus fissidentatus TaxID=1538716 RepID=A0AAV5US21_9BILA|nr:hypothetical protein PFISCL1PPCAC_558 [Pristionchus fissidentatus]
MSHGGKHVEVYLEDSDDEERRRRRKHKKKHRRRSRSSSESASPPPAVSRSVHINPIIAHTIADAQLLQQRVAAQDLQMHHMGAELASAHARINILEGQLNRVSNDKALLEARCTPLEQQNARLIEQLEETKKVLQVLEPAVTNYQKANENLTKEKQEAAIREKVTADELRAVKNAYQSAKEQAEFVGKRNEVLARKCEEVVARNKQLEEDKAHLFGEATQSRTHAEEMAKSAMEMKRRAEIAERDRSTLSAEKQALVDREGVWRAEKADMEKKIIYKESQIRSQKRQHEDEIRLEKERYTKLEVKYREQDSSFASEDAINSVKKAMEIMRSSLEEQVNMMRKRIGEEIEVEIIASTPSSKSAPVPSRIRSPSPIEKKRMK